MLSARPSQVTRSIRDPTNFFFFCGSFLALFLLLSLFKKNHPQARWSCPFPGSWPWEGCQLPPTTTISVLIHGTQVGREKREKKDVKGDLEDSPLPLPEASKQQGPVCIREQLR